MPRRRRKSTIARRPELVFTESPVHIQNNVPSPVLCARHPPTASSIPIEDLHDLHWVSPQFRSIRSSGGHGKRKLTRQRRHSIAGHRNTTHCTRNKENITAGLPLPNGVSKFKSLKFIGDQTTIASIVENVEITIDTDTGTEDEDVNVPVVCIHRKRGRGAPCKKCNDLNLKNKTNDNLTTSDRQQFGDNVNGLRPISETAQNDQIIAQKRLYLDLSNSNFEEDDYTGTQRRDSTKDKPPIKRLFASQLLPKCDLDSNTGEGLIQNVECEEINTRLSDVTGEPESVQESDSEKVDSPSVRRSARIQRIQNMLKCADSPISGRTKTLKNSVILAPNTPESEYGWSKRKRQLIQYLKH